MSAIRQGELPEECVWVTCPGRYPWDPSPSGVCNRCGQDFGVEPLPTHDRPWHVTGREDDGGKSDG
jgi:hypothetical protein